VVVTITKIIIIAEIFFLKHPKLQEAILYKERVSTLMPQILNLLTPAAERWQRCPAEPRHT
jgi:hypothetical protein